MYALEEAYAIVGSWGISVLLELTKTAYVVNPSTMSKAQRRVALIIVGRALLFLASFGSANLTTSIFRSAQRNNEMYKAPGLSWLQELDYVRRFALALLVEIPRIQTRLSKTINGARSVVVSHVPFCFNGLPSISKTSTGPIALSSLASFDASPTTTITGWSIEMYFLAAS